MKRYHAMLLAVFAAVWVWAAIAPRHPQDWLLENYLVFAFVPLILLAGRHYRLSNFSYTLITAFMLLHVVGSHYTYAEVPFGTTLQHWFGSARNMYDRLVHFSFGLLMVYPLREMALRVARVRGVWAYGFPLCWCWPFLRRTRSSNGGWPTASIPRRAWPSWVRRATSGTRRRTWR